VILNPEMTGDSNTEYCVLQMAARTSALQMCLFSKLNPIKVLDIRGIFSSNSHRYVEGYLMLQ
jgi:hypothetical protein